MFSRLFTLGFAVISAVLIGAIGIIIVLGVSLYLGVTFIYRNVTRS